MAYVNHAGSLWCGVCKVGERVAAVVLAALRDMTSNGFEVILWSPLSSRYQTLAASLHSHCALSISFLALATVLSFVLICLIKLLQSPGNRDIVVSVLS